MKLQFISERSDQAQLEALLGQGWSMAGRVMSGPSPGPAADASASETTWSMTQLQLPWAAGLLLIAEVRQALPRVGIVVTDAHQGVVERVRAYDVGADIFMNGSASEDEILAMALAMVRRLRQARWRDAALSLVA